MQIVQNVLLIHEKHVINNWQMLWELRAEPLAGSPDVIVEMRQVPGYLDFLAEIMPPDVRENHLS